MITCRRLRTWQSAALVAVVSVSACRDADSRADNAGTTDAVSADAAPAASEAKTDGLPQSFQDFLRCVSPCSRPAAISKGTARDSTYYDMPAYPGAIVVTTDVGGKPSARGVYPVHPPYRLDDPAASEKSEAYWQSFIAFTDELMDSILPGPCPKARELVHYIGSGPMHDDGTPYVMCSGWRVSVGTRGDLPTIIITKV